MKKTAQPTGATATNLRPLPIQDRQEQSYRKKGIIARIKQRPFLDWGILVVVIVVALVVIALSFSNTGKLAMELRLNPWLTAGLVEILFASLLTIRARQRAMQRNVPFFLTLGYYTSLAFVTGVNMWGLYQENEKVGLIVGGAISGAMWLMETTLVWLWTDSHQPHQKSLRELKREAKREREKMKLIQEMEWMRWEAQKPNLDLIKKARKADEKREQVVRAGIPEFFRLEESPQENLETSHPASSHLETGGMEKSPTEKLETSKLENLESGELENPPAMEGGDLEEVKLETSKLETGELKTSRLEEVKLEGQEKLETGDLETSDQKPEEKPEESITNWKLKTLQPALEKQVEPAPLKDSALEGEPLEDGKREAGELEKPESGDLENLETSKLEESATGEMETSSLEDLEVETGEQIGELEEKLETPKLETGESSNLENQKQETSKVEKVEKEEKFTKEDLEHFSREELEAMKGADPEDVAVRILEREGELPGRPRLKRLTGCTEWDARKTLRELKKELNAS